MALQKLQRNILADIFHHFVACGDTVTIPSANRSMVVASDCVYSTSYTYCPAETFAVFVAVIEIVTFDPETDVEKVCILLPEYVDCLSLAEVVPEDIVTLPPAVFLAVMVFSNVDP